MISIVLFIIIIIFILLLYTLILLTGFIDGPSKFLKDIKNNKCNYKYKVCCKIKEDIQDENNSYKKSIYNSIVKLDDSHIELYNNTYCMR